MSTISRPSYDEPPRRFEKTHSDLPDNLNWDMPSSQQMSDEYPINNDMCRGFEPSPGCSGENPSKRRKTIQGSNSGECDVGDDGDSSSAYVSILKDLAAAVQRTPPPTPLPPPKRTGLELWSDVLVSNMSDLPLEMQQEARLHIDSYIMSLRRQVKPYVIQPKKGPGKNVKNKQNPPPASHTNPSSDQYIDPNCASNMNITPPKQPQPSPQLTPSRNTTLQPLQNVYNMSQYSPMSSVYQNPTLGGSPATQSIINALLCGAPQLPQYQGQM